MAIGDAPPSDDLPLLPPEATPTQPSIAGQQAQHAADQPPSSGDNLPLAAAPPPSVMHSSWSQLGKQLWDEGSRGVGLGARAALEGLSGIVGATGDVMTWPGRAINKAVGYQPPPELPWMKDLTVAPSTQIGQAIDATGLPTSQTPTEQNVSTVVRGAAGAAPGLSGAPTVLNAARLLLQGGGGALAGEKAAGSDLVPEYLKPTVNLLASMVGAKAADIGAGTAAKVVNAAASNMSPEYDAFVRAGVTPKLLGTVAGGDTGQSLEAAVSRVPFASQIIRPVQQQAVDQFGRSLDRTASQLDPAGASITAQTTGDFLQNAYRNWQGTTFQNNQAAKWNPLNQRMAGSSVDPSSYRAALDDAANPPSLASAPANQQAFGSPQAKRWLDALNTDFPPGQNLSWEQAQAIKQRIGDAMGTPDLVSSVGMTKLKSIYGGLADGMKTTATQHGQDALFNEANAVTTAGHAFMDNVGSKIATANNPLQESITPEQATNNILNSGDTTMQAVRDQMPDAADTLGAYKLRQAATAKPSSAGPYNDTSTGTFLTNMNRMRQNTPGGYGALYNDPITQGQLDDLTTVAQRLRETERHINTSGTAEQLGWMQYLKGIGEAGAELKPGPLIGAVAIPPAVGYLGGKLVTSPLATRVAAAQGAGPPIMPPSRGGLLGSIPQLAAGQ